MMLYTFMLKSADDADKINLMKRTGQVGKGLDLDLKDQRSVRQLDDILRGMRPDVDRFKIGGASIRQAIKFIPLLKTALEGRISVDYLLQQKENLAGFLICAAFLLKNPKKTPGIVSENTNISFKEHGRDIMLEGYGYGGSRYSGDSYRLNVADLENLYANFKSLLIKNMDTQTSLHPSGDVSETYTEDQFKRAQALLATDRTLGKEGPAALIIGIMTKLSISKHIAGQLMKDVWSIDPADYPGLMNETPSATTNDQSSQLLNSLGLTQDDIFRIRFAYANEPSYESIARATNIEIERIMRYLTLTESSFYEQLGIPTPFRGNFSGAYIDKMFSILEYRDSGNRLGSDITEQDLEFARQVIRSGAIESFMGDNRGFSMREVLVEALLRIFSHDRILALMPILEREIPELMPTHSGMAAMRPHYRTPPTPAHHNGLTRNEETAIKEAYNAGITQEEILGNYPTNKHQLVSEFIQQLSF